MDMRPSADELSFYTKMNGTQDSQNLDFTTSSSSKRQRLYQDPTGKQGGDGPDGGEADDGAAGNGNGNNDGDKTGSGNSGEDPNSANENSMIDSEILQHQLKQEQHQQQQQQQQQHQQQQQQQQQEAGNIPALLEQSRLHQQQLQQQQSERKRTYSGSQQGSGLGVSNTSSAVYNNTVATAAAAVVSGVGGNVGDNSADSNNGQQHSHLIMHNSMGSPQVPKPAVGSQEWHKLRRDNHKEVERRRRENINDGIQALSQIVPNCDKNKGQILQRAVEYIKQLKDNEAANIEKWTIEKLLTEQSIAELSATNEKLKKELAHAWKEVALWKEKSSIKSDGINDEQ